MGTFPLDLAPLGPHVAVDALRVTPPGMPTTGHCPSPTAQQLKLLLSVPWPQKAEGDGALGHPLGKGPAAPFLPARLQEFEKHLCLESGQRLEKWVSNQAH